VEPAGSAPQAAVRASDREARARRRILFISHIS
jgi:hypothetical protein